MWGGGGGGGGFCMKIKKREGRGCLAQYVILYPIAFVGENDSLI